MLYTAGPLYHHGLGGCGLATRITFMSHPLNTQPFLKLKRDLLVDAPAEAEPPRCRPKHTVERLETYIRLSANPWTLTQTTHGASPIPRNLSKEKVLAAYDISHAGSWQAYCRQPSSQVNNSSTSATSEITSLFFAELSIAVVSFHGNEPMVLLLPLCSLLNLLLHQENRAGLTEHLNKPKTDSFGS